MDIDGFWKLIEQSKRGTEDCDEQAEKLTEILEKLTQEEVVSFDKHFQSLRIQAYTWDLWGVAYLINGGCSDDGFDYFRAWLIAQGRKRFEAALQDAESVSSYAEPDECECEDILYVTAQVYEEKAGSPLPDDGIRLPSEPLGSSWEEDELEQRFPKTAKKFAD